MTRKQPEAALQRQIVQYIEAVLPSHICAAIPNGAQRTAAGYAANAVPGLYPGAPDLILIGPLGHCAFIEVKADGGRLSLAQQALHARFATMGVPYCVARSINDVKAALAHWRYETREAA